MGVQKIDGQLFSKPDSTVLSLETSHSPSMKYVSTHFPFHRPSFTRGKVDPFVVKPLLPRLRVRCVKGAFLTLVSPSLSGLIYDVIRA